MRDKLTRREDRALLKALREIVLTQYPNPERKDCPGTSVLRAIATKRINMFDAAHEHVGSCSPCFKELTEIRRRLRRRNILMWATSAAATAIVVVSVLLTYPGPQRQENPVARQREQTIQANNAQGSTDSADAIKTAPAPTPPQPKYEMAVLDLRDASRSGDDTANRDASVARSVEPAAPSSNAKPIEITRGLLTLLVQLPVGSDSGPYEVQIRDAKQQPIRNAKSEAVIENGITKLSINLDVRSVPPGEYEFAWRQADFSWRHYPISIR